MQTHWFILLATLVFNPIAAQAQRAAPRDPDAAARAAREASNPLRIIIEASKLKSRATEAPVPEKRPVRPVRPVAAKPPTLVPVAAKEEAAPVAMEAASQPPAEPAAVVPALARAEPAPVPATLSLPAPVVPAPRLAPPLPLKLVQLVEPSLSSMVVRRMRADAEVVVGFTVNADGTVSDVAVRSSPMQALDDAVVEAVSQWRYEPIGAARTHAVQLVLRASR
jgi:TonB family protein